MKIDRRPLELLRRSGHKGCSNMKVESGLLEVGGQEGRRGMMVKEERETTTNFI